MKTTVHKAARGFHHIADVPVDAHCDVHWFDDDGNYTGTSSEPAINFFRIGDICIKTRLSSGWTFTSLWSLVSMPCGDKKNKFTEILVEPLSGAEMYSKMERTP